MTWPAGARRWTEAEIAEDVQRARAEFRRRRLAEPLTRYLQVFDETRPVHARLLPMLRTLMSNSDGNEEELLELLRSDAGQTALRYLSAPPISKDDLETLAEGRLSTAATTGNAKAWQGVLDVLRSSLDPRRFPWVAEGRDPGPAELEGAVLATTALSASQRVQTLRRGDEKSAVEGAVKGVLIGMGWELATSRRPGGISNLLADAPAHRHFMVQVNLGADNADLVVRLDDGRLLAVECKGSNSEINSRKRLNKEAAQNARAWLANFGSQVVPAVALQGVFKDRYVAEAQATPLLVFWGHRMSDLREFIERCVR